ncbi:hypothetical protein L2E82_27939 [Cichorium intybus]|uniref:Uncharacterized protein n=1 Tax=Cichorium intybus TaxID=13427 RepID=A0ACB9CUQ8_CICIN|nr:hypothetical protein L2E82_27939 [Cichorium intybus]
MHFSPSKIIVNKRAAEQQCLSILQTCKTLLNLNQVHAQILKLGLQNNPLVLTKFTSTSSDLNAIDYASLILFSPDAKTHLYDTFLYNTVIRAYAQTNKSKITAVDIYKTMVWNDVMPNKFTYPFVLKACAGVGRLYLGESVHGNAL